jgi:hypothetical protein
MMLMQIACGSRTCWTFVRDAERMAPLVVDLGLVMGSPEVYATPSAAPPQPRGLDFQRQYARKPARSQRITLSGLTIFKASSTPGASRYNPANTRRSMLVKVSRCGDLRRSTLS